MFLEVARFLFYSAVCHLLLGLMLRWEGQHWAQCFWLNRLAIITTFLSWIIGFVNHDTSIVAIADHLEHITNIEGALGLLWAGASGANLLFFLGMSESACAVYYQALWQLTASERFKVQRLLLSHLLFITLVILWHSDPFARYWPIPPMRGQELNPLLQHTALSYHPPLLLLGTSSLFAVVGLDTASLVAPHHCYSRLRKKWLSWSLGILGFGITAGSHWAYHVLGWGGWWFWDPIETISLINWVGALALLHQPHPSRIQKWSSFALWACIVIGLILVRGGGLISVHSFVHERPSVVLICWGTWSLLGAIWPLVRAKSSTASADTGLVAIVLVMLSGLLTPVILTALGSESHHLSASYYDNTVGVCLLFFMLLDSFPSIVALGYLASVSFLSLPLTALWAVLLLGQQLLFKKMSRAVVAHSLVLMGVIFMSIAPHFEWQQYVPLYATDSVAIHDLSVSSGNDTTQVDKGRTTIERPIVIQTRWQKLPVIARKIRYHAWEQELTPISYTTSMWGEDFGVSIAADGGLRVFYRPFVRVIWMMMLGLSSLFLWTVYAPVMTQLGMVIKSWLFKIYSLWFGNSQKSIIRPLVFLKSTLLPDNLSKSLF